MSYNPDLHGFIDMSTTTLHESRVCMELLYFTCWPGPIFDPCRNGTQQPSLPVRRHPDCSWLVAWVQLPCEIAGWSPQPWSWMKLDSFREDLGGIPQRDPKGTGKPARKEPAQQRSAAPEALGVGPVQNLGTTDVWRCLHQAHWMGAGWPRLQGWTQQVDAWSVWLEVGSWPCPKNVLTMAKWLAFAEKSWAFIALRGVSDDFEATKWTPFSKLPLNCWTLSPESSWGAKVQRPSSLGMLTSERRITQTWEKRDALGWTDIYLVPSCTMFLLMMAIPTDHPTDGSGCFLSLQPFDRPVGRLIHVDGQWCRVLTGQ